MLLAADAARKAWLAQPDAQYFGGELEASLRRSVQSAAQLLGAKDESTISLVENSTTAAAIVVNRWRDEVRERGGRVLMLSVAYGGVIRLVETILGAGSVTVVDVPFPGTSRLAVLDQLHAKLKEQQPRFALIDHISSQPSIELPLAEMIAQLRSAGVSEIAVDGAHGAGQFAQLQVDQLDADWYFSNLHKWAFAPPTACALYGKPHLTATTRHVIPSWSGQSAPLSEASLWTGTRDYSSFVAVGEACRYLREWRSASGEEAYAYNRRGLRAAIAQLRDAWRVDPAYDEDDCLCAMGMIRLPDCLDISRDQPGQPTGSDSIRSCLRSRYGVEAALGGFVVPDPTSGGNRLQGFLRLSHAVYTSDEDIASLRDAVLDLVDGT